MCKRYGQIKFEIKTSHQKVYMYILWQFAWGYTKNIVPLGVFGIKYYIKQC